MAYNRQSVKCNSMNEITFVIVAYSSEETLAASVESCISTLNAQFGGRGKLVIVDNASPDRCSQIIERYESKYPDQIVNLRFGRNLGFGRANNRAVELFPSRVYALINPDVVFEPVTVLRLHELLLSSEDIAIACPKLIYPDNSVQPSVRTFPTFTYLALRNALGESLQKKLYPFKYYCEEFYSAQAPCEVDWAIGAFMLVSGNYVTKYGLFDERYFLYFEDVSLCLSAWKHGFRVLYDPQATAVHFYQRASMRSPFSYLRLLHTVSAIKFFAKYPEFLFSGKFVRPTLRSSQTRRLSMEARQPPPRSNEHSE